MNTVLRPCVACGLLFAGATAATSLPVTNIPYKGGAQMLTDVVGGQLDVGVIDFGGTIELLKGPRLRVLAITGDKREPKFSDISTMKALGESQLREYGRLKRVADLAGIKPE
jgi:tripartite-type tricarboxylate transporter receptor subunit TctC